MIRAKNKTALLELKKDLELVHNGAEILEEKRNILLKEIMGLLDEVDAERAKLNEAVRQSYRSLTKAFMESGRIQLRREAELPVFSGELHVYERSFMGILTPAVTYELRQVRFPLDISSETLFMEVARHAFIETTAKILALAEIELKAWRLARELQKCIVRVNALQNHYVPEYDRAIRETSAALEESEREFLLAVKQAKALRQGNGVD